MKRKGISLDIPILAKCLKKIALVNRENTGLDELKKLILNYRIISNKPLVQINLLIKNTLKILKTLFLDNYFTNFG